MSRETRLRELLAECRPWVTLGLDGDGTCEERHRIDALLSRVDAALAEPAGEEERWGVWCEPTASNGVGHPQWLSDGHDDGRPNVYASREEAEAAARREADALSFTAWTYSANPLPPRSPT